MERETNEEKSEATIRGVFWGGFSNPKAALIGRRFTGDGAPRAQSKRAPPPSPHPPTHIPHTPPAPGGARLPAKREAPS